MRYSSFAVKTKNILHNKSVIHGGLYSLYSFMGKGISFLLLILLANYIKPAEYGLLSMFSTVIMVVSFFLGFSSSGYVSNSYFQKSGVEFKKDFTAIFILHIVTAIVLGIIILLVRPIITQFTNLPTNVTNYVVIISLSNALFLITQNLFRIKENIVGYGVLSISNAIISFVLSLLLVVTFGQDWLGRVNAYLITSVVFAVYSICYFVKQRLFLPDFSFARYKVILLWSIPLIPHLATTWLRQGCDQYIINYHYSTYEVGVFSFALTMVSVISIIGDAFNATSSVNLYRILSSSDENKTERLRKLRFFLFGVFTFILVVSVPMLSLGIWFFLPQYHESIPYFLLLSLYGYLTCLYFIYVNYLFYFNETKTIMYITFCSSLLHLALSLLFTRFSLYFTVFIYIIVQGFIVLLVRNRGRKILRSNSLL